MITTSSDSENTRSTDLSDRFVTVTRNSHPYHGQKLEVLDDGIDQCLYVLLPDGSRSLISKGWTDYSESTCSDLPSEGAQLLDLDELCEIVKMIDRMKEDGRFPVELPDTNEAINDSA
jgi:hypothetical protein